MNFKLKTKRYFSNSSGEYSKFNFIIEDDYELIFTAIDKDGRRQLFHVLKNCIINEIYIASYKIILGNTSLRKKYRTYSSVNISTDKNTPKLDVFLVIFNFVNNFAVNTILNAAMRQASKYSPLLKVQGNLEPNEIFHEEYSQISSDFNLDEKISKTLRAYLNINRIVADLYSIGLIDNMCFLHGITAEDSVAIFTSKLKSESSATIDYQAICNDVLSSMRAALKSGDEKAWIDPYKMAFWPMRAHSGNKLILDKKTLRNIVLSNKISDPRWYSSGYIKNNNIKLKEGANPIIAGHYFSAKDELKVNDTPMTRVKKKDNIVGERLSGGYRTYPFYNAEDMEGMAAYIPKAWDIEKEHQIKKFIDQINPSVIHKKATIEPGCAFYDPRGDYISMPDKANFISEYEYYATFLHEVVHWSGHSSRLDRVLNSSTDEAYAYEELVAELASCFLMSSLGAIDFKVDNHASYISIWINQIEKGVIKFDKAIEDAIDAFLYLHDLVA